MAFCNSTSRERHFSSRRSRGGGGHRASSPQGFGRIDMQTSRAGTLTNLSGVAFEN